MKLTPIQWVALATCKSSKSTGSTRSCIHVIDGAAYGTDGYRMHQCATTMPDGAYDPETLEPVEFRGDVSKYPGVQAVRKGEVRVPIVVSDLEVGHVAIDGLKHYKSPNDDRFYYGWVQEAVRGNNSETVYYSGGGFAKLTGIAIFDCGTIGMFSIMRTKY